MKHRARRLLKKSRPAASKKRLMRTLAACGGEPAEMLELYYWSREPGLRQLFRAIATMSEPTRAALEAFVMLARDAKSITGDLDPRGMLMLYSAEAGKTVALARYAADDDEGLRRLLN
jgi:hypothetical protein